MNHSNLKKFPTFFLSPSQQKNECPQVILPWESRGTFMTTFPPFLSAFRGAIRGQIFFQESSAPLENICGDVVYKKVGMKGLGGQSKRRKGEDHSFFLFKNSTFVIFEPKKLQKKNQIFELFCCFVTSILCRFLARKFKEFDTLGPKNQLQEKLSFEPNQAKIFELKIPKKFEIFKFSLQKLAFFRYFVNSILVRLFFITKLQKIFYF